MPYQPRCPGCCQPLPEDPTKGCEICHPKMTVSAETTIYYRCDKRHAILTLSADGKILTLASWSDILFQYDFVMIDFKHQGFYHNKSYAEAMRRGGKIDVSPCAFDVRILFNDNPEMTPMEPKYENP